MRTWIGAVLALVVVACGSGSAKKTQEEAPDSIAECDAYVAAYEGCVSALGPESAGVARERGAALRVSFAPPKDDAQRETLRTKCVQASAQLVVNGRCR